MLGRKKKKQIQSYLRLIKKGEKTLENMAENIFLFVPNLIGYARIVLAILSFYYMPFDHIKATVFYVLR